MAFSPNSTFVNRLQSKDFYLVNIFPLMIDERKRGTLKSAVFGFAVGDALGVPHEFKTREELSISPVNGMDGYGTHQQPAGTWSDDTSMLLCVTENLLENGDASSLAGKFLNWYNSAAYTATGEVFDVGVTTSIALNNVMAGADIRSSGATDEFSAGNGSLMRCLPYAFIADTTEAERKLLEEGRITHAHDLCSEATLFYIFVARCLLDGCAKEALLPAAIKAVSATKWARTNRMNRLASNCRLFNDSFSNTEVDQIKSTGYVVESLEACLWCFLSTDSYQSAVQTAVNLGGDTDTIAALTGGLAGIYYGYNTIPEEWLRDLKGKHIIDRILIF